MAASKTRRGRRTTSTSAPQNASNRDNSALRQRVARWRREGREILTELFFSAADSALDVTPPLARVTSRTTSTEIVEPATVATPRRRRGRATAATATAPPANVANVSNGRRRRARTVDTSNLGGGDRVIDRVYNALPPSGAINRQTLRETVSRNGGVVRAQDIGAALRVLEERGIARRNGEIIERLRAAA